MIQKCIEANPAKFARYAKVATIVGWILLIASVVMLLPTLFQYHRIVRHWYKLWYGVIQIVHPAFFSMFFLLLGQFLKYELGLEEQPGWFFRNGGILLRIYAAVIIGGIIIQYTMMITSLVQTNRHVVLLSIINIFHLVNIAKVLLLWGLAGVVKMMMDEIHKNSAV